MRKLQPLSLALALLVGSAVAQADLLERVKLEDALRARLEQIVRVKDPKAQVLARVDFKTYESELPGTSGLKETYVPNKVESSDIAKVDVEIYTELKELPEETKAALYKNVPVSKNFLKISVKQLDPAPTTQTQKAVEAKDLSEIAQQSVKSIEDLTKIVLGSLVGSIVLALGTMFFYSSRKMKEFKDQFALLANAISESGGSRSVGPAALPAPQAITVSASQSSDRIFERLPQAALNELFSDCYWCENDSYAHWLWKQLSPSQRTESFDQLPFMKDYSSHFVQVPAKEMSFHEHPFYLNPISTAQVSMVDLNAALEKDLSLWPRLSPIRQAATAIGLEKKLQALEVKKPSSFDMKALPASSARKFKASISLGDLSIEDESALFRNPELAPAPLRKQLRSLVWLAHKDDETIRKTLARFDARSLASVWIGPDEVLKKLEQQIPEKKLKLLANYRQKENPSRQSSTFDALVEEGLKDEAA